MPPALIREVRVSSPASVIFIEYFRLRRDAVAAFFSFFDTLFHIDIILQTLRQLTLLFSPLRLR